MISYQVFKDEWWLGSPLVGLMRANAVSFIIQDAVFMWRKTDESWKSECLQATVKHSGLSIMVWSAIWYDLVDFLLYVEKHLMVKDTAMFLKMEWDALFFSWILLSTFGSIWTGNSSQKMQHQEQNNSFRRVGKMRSNGDPKTNSIHFHAGRSCEIC